MFDLDVDPPRVAVWMAMASHFLDTETRQDIPLTALTCVRAGFPISQARDVWRYEVSPVVWWNLWDMAGEWAGWDRDWLVEAIERVRREWGQRAGTGRWLRYRLRVHFGHAYLVSIERCMAALLNASSSADQDRMARDLAFLAHHYFDCCPPDLSASFAAEHQRIRSLYPEPFRHLMAPALVRGEARLADQRVLAALGQKASP